MKITIAESTDHAPTLGSSIDVVIHNSGSEAAYIRSIKMSVFGLDSTAKFYDISNRREVANNLVPANGVEDFFTPVANLVTTWRDLPEWKKSVAAAVRHLRITVTVQDAGANAYKGTVHLPWRSGNSSTD